MYDKVPSSGDKTQLLNALILGFKFAIYPSVKNANTFDLIG